MHRFSAPAPAGPVRAFFLGALAVLASATWAAPTFTMGYSDMPASVSVTSSIYHSGNMSYMNVNYQVTSTGLSPYTKSFTGVPIYNSSTGTGMAPMNLPGDDLVFPHLRPIAFTYHGGAQQFEVHWEAGGSLWSGVYRNDPFIAALKADYYARVGAISSAQLSQDRIVKWTRKHQVDDALAANAKYDGSRISIDLPFQGLVRAFPPLSGGADDFASMTPRAFATVTYGPNPDYFAKVYCFPGMGDADNMNKPVLVTDAFDPLDKRSAWGIYENKRYRKLLSTDAGHPRAAGYDVFFVDFAQGGGDILINASLTLKFLEWLQAQPSGRVIVGGPSMGGIVTRLALLYSMPSNNLANGPGLRGRDLARKVKGYLSIDSPHLGASISPDVQEAVYDLAMHGDVNWAADVFDTPNSAIEQLGQVNSPAAHQMLYGHYYESYMGQPEARTPESHAKFYGFLDGLGGYRRDLPGAAIAYSNLFKPHSAMLRNRSHTTGYVSAEGIAIRHFGVGVNDMDKHELAPGSCGDWYFRLRTHSRTPNVFPYRSSIYSQTWFNFFDETSDLEVFKGTFIPFYSALGLSNFDVYSPPATDEAGIAAYSPFRFTYFMHNADNGYYQFLGRTDGRHGWAVDRKRYEHILFDNQLMPILMRALQDLEGAAPKPRMPTSVTSLLLLN